MSHVKFRELYRQLTHTAHTAGSQRENDSQTHVIHTHKLKDKHVQCLETRFTHSRMQSYTHSGYPREVQGRKRAFQRGDRYQQASIKEKRRREERTRHPARENSTVLDKRKGETAES